MLDMKERLFCPSAAAPGPTIPPLPAGLQPHDILDAVGGSGGLQARVFGVGLFIPVVDLREEFFCDLGVGAALFYEKECFPLAGSCSVIGRIGGMGCGGLGRKWGLFAIADHQWQ